MLTLKLLFLIHLRLRNFICAKHSIHSWLSAKDNQVKSKEITFDQKHNASTFYYLKQQLLEDIHMYDFLNKHRIQITQIEFWADWFSTRLFYLCSFWYSVVML